MHGGAGRKRVADLQPGNMLSVQWRGRLESQLGRYEMAESRRPFATHILHRPLALAALTSLTTLLRASVEEGDQQGSLMYPPTTVLLDAMCADEADAIWPRLYVRWELGLLESLGFGLDTERCAISGGGGMMDMFGGLFGDDKEEKEEEEDIFEKARFPLESTVEIVSDYKNPHLERLNMKGWVGRVIDAEYDENDEIVYFTWDFGDGEVRENLSQ